jgi:CRP-like cAMP-binding protein
MTRSETTQFPQSLDGIAIFAGLSPEERSALRKRCAWRRYEPGEPIVDYLDKSTDVYFVTAGEVRASLYSVAGKAVTFTELGPGDMFGEIAAIDRGPRSASIEARSTCTMASMPASVFLEVLEAEPTVMLALLHQLAARVRSLTTRVYEFSALAVNNRIHAELLRLAGPAPREGRGVRIETAPTHAEIASRVSTHREAVTREFSRLARLGLVEQHGRALIVKDLGRLAEMVRDATGE